MISQSLYFDLCANYNGNMADIEMISFLNPYILVIHLPSRQGFYLDSVYQHIISVSDCEDPESFVLRRPFTCYTAGRPLWAQEIRENQFDTFFLYER